MRIRYQAMNAFGIFQVLFVLFGLIDITEAELSLRVISPHGESTINGLNVPKDFECNAETTFVCEVKPYIDSVTWQVNGTTYAVCVFQNCLTYPPFPENHIFTMDLASEVFNITVNPVTNATNNNIYKCDDGTTGRSVNATVKVFPNNDTLNIDETAGDRITVTTGCVYPNGMEDVTFEWFITKDSTSLGGEPLTSKSESTIIFTCTETQSCTVEETSHFNNTVVFDIFDDGEDYYIYVIIKHMDAPNRPSTVKSTGKRFKVKDIDCHYYIIIIIIVALRITLMQTLVAGYMHYRTFPNGGHTVDYKWMRFVVGIPFFGFIVLIKTTSGWMKQGSCSIVWSLVATFIDPALGICVTSILFARWNKVTIPNSLICRTLLAIVCWICIEVLMLIQCKVLRWNGLYYLLLIILYLVILWLYLTYVVMFLVDNLFSCKLCNNPVECCNLQTVEYMCAKCYESNKQDTQEQCAEGQNADVENITVNLNKVAFPCQINETPFHEQPFHEQEKKIRGSVYCLVCKLYLCKHCFELHRRIQYVWEERQQPATHSGTDVIHDGTLPLAKHHESPKPYQVSKTNIGLMVWWHFPLVGIGIAFLHWYWQFKQDQEQVNPAKQES